MISTLTAATRPNASLGSGPNVAQAANAAIAASDHRRHEPAGDLIGEPLDRRARALRVGDHLHDLRQQRVAADLVGAHDKTARLVQRARDHARTLLLGDGQGFAGHQGFVECGTAFEDLAVDRNLLARPHAQFVAGREGIDLDFVVVAVVVDAPRGLRRQPQQRLDRARGRLACAQLQHLSKQHENGDDSGGLEIDGNRATMAAEAGREGLRDDRPDQAIDIGHPGADRDQREHVEMARDQRLPAAHEEWPARPQYDRCCKCKLDPVRERRIDQAVAAGEMHAHLEHDRRHRQHRTNPEAAAHVGKLGIGRRIQADDIGLKRHAADRTASRTGLSDFGMHRAGIDRARGSGRAFLRLVLVEVFRGVSGEFGAAAGAAEMEGLAAIVEAMLRGLGIDRHAANGIAHGGRVMPVMMAGVT